MARVSSASVRNMRWSCMRLYGMLFGTAFMRDVGFLVGHTFELTGMMVSLKYTSFLRRRRKKPAWIPRN